MSSPLNEKSVLTFFLPILLCFISWFRCSVISIFCLLSWQLFVTMLIWWSYECGFCSAHLKLQNLKFWHLQADYIQSILAWNVHIISDYIRYLSQTLCFWSCFKSVHILCIPNEQNSSVLLQVLKIFRVDFGTAYKSLHDSKAHTFSASRTYLFHKNCEQYLYLDRLKVLSFLVTLVFNSQDWQNRRTAWWMPAVPS